MCAFVFVYFWRIHWRRLRIPPPCSFLKHLHFQWISCCLQTFILALVCVDLWCIRIALQKHSSLRIEEAQTIQVSKRYRHIFRLWRQDVGQWCDLDLIMRAPGSVCMNCSLCVCMSVCINFSQIVLSCLYNMKAMVHPACFVSPLRLASNTIFLWISPQIYCAVLLFFSC